MQDYEQQMEMDREAEFTRALAEERQEEAYEDEEPEEDVARER